MSSSSLLRFIRSLVCGEFAVIMLLTLGSTLAALLQNFAGFVVYCLKSLQPRGLRCTLLQTDYVSRSVPSTSGQRVSKSLSRWSPRCNTFWIRCCVSGQVSAVSKEVIAARSRSADGNETWLTRFFAAAMARRSKEAIRRASASTKPSSSASGSARLTYPYRSCGIAVEIVRAENDFERPTAPDQMWKTFRTAAAGMHSHPDFGLAESRVLARREAHVAGEDELAAHAPATASDPRDADHRGLGETHERIH